MNTHEIYQRRFKPDIDFRKKMWKVLCDHFFQRYISINDTVLEVGAGYCEFINNIHAGRKIAIDINPDTKEYADPNVEVLISRSESMDQIESGLIDVVFVSNFFEHLERGAISETLQEIYRILKTGGKLIILQPNIRYAFRDYWMFFDHITPIDDRALVEVLEINRFRLIRIINKFLPFTTKSGYPRAIFLIRLYLAIRPVWYLFGKQSLLIAEKMVP